MKKEKVKRRREQLKKRPPKNLIMKYE